MECNTYAKIWCLEEDPDIGVKRKSQVYVTVLLSEPISMYIDARRIEPKKKWKCYENHNKMIEVLTVEVFTFRSRIWIKLWELFAGAKE